MSNNSGRNQHPYRKDGAPSGDNSPPQDENNKNNNVNRPLGQRISDTVMGALHSGDLSRLKDIGPAIQDAVKDIPGASIVVNSNNKRTPAPAWMGKGYMANNKRPSSFTGILPMVFGGLGLGLFGIIGAGVLTANLMGGISSFLSGMLVSAFFLACAAFSGIGMLAGRGKRRLAKAAWHYCALLEEKPVRTFAELAICTGKTVDTVKKEVRKALRKGMLRNVRVDEKETCLMYGEKAHELYLNSLKQDQQRKLEDSERARMMKEDPEKAALENFKAEGVATLRKIREANDAIPGEEISEKLQRLEATTGKIFAYVEKHPQKMPDTRRFMDYYLPTTLKLVDKYRQYDENELQVDNIKKAKKEIEQTLESIDVAFNNLLNNLYQEDTLDVFTDIEVLQSVLKQEGLMGDSFEIDLNNSDDTPLRL